MHAVSRSALLCLALAGCIDLGRDVVQSPSFKVDAQVGAADGAGLGQDARADVAPVMDRGTPDRGTSDRGPPDGGAADLGPEVDAAPPPDQGLCAECVPGEVRPCGAAEGVCFVSEQPCIDGCWAPCPGLAGQAPETCDGTDQDCDGQVDEGLGLGEPCAVGVGGCSRAGLFACRADRAICSATPAPPSAEVCNGIDDDCDGVFDEALNCPECLDDEVCNGADDDCDERIDEGVLNACGACGLLPPETCDGVDDDCDGDTDEGVTNACGACGPVPPEACDGDDNDCDGRTDEGVTNACGGCGRVPDELCNDADDDCDGAVDEGQRNDCGGCGPEPGEVCNDADDDCDGRIDEGGACAGEQEVCDGADQDRDGRVDEGLERPCGSNTGACSAGTETCAAGQWGACVGDTGPQPETCDGVDEDCDGNADEDLVRACGRDVGVCRRGSETCRNGDWGACEGETRPRAEGCNDRDDDCDGATDEGLSRLCGTNVGVCRRGEEVCNAGEWGACDATLPRAETCDGADEDCDGATDEGTTNLCGACGPVPAESCNGVDDDCDGATDEGVRNPCGGCGDVPGEVCNGADDDCDGRTDEGVANACGGCGPVPRESCNNVDDDCDGAIDEGLSQACGSDVGACRRGSSTCLEGIWGRCVGEITPTDETCDGVDEDCDAATDEDTGGQVCTLGHPGGGANCFTQGVRVCENGALVCDAPPPIGRVESCDGEDNDCDGRVDEGFQPVCQPR